MIVGSGSRGAAQRRGGAELPLGTMWIGPRKPSRRRSSWRVDGETAATGAVPYTATGRRALQEAAHGGEHRAEAHVELVLVHVVHHLHDRHVRPDEQRREERDAVLAVDDVRRRGRGGAAGQRGARVERERAARPDDVGCRRSPRAADCPAAARGQPGDVRAGRDPPPRDLVHVLLGAAGLRMSDVAPVEHEHPRSPASCGERGASGPVAPVTGQLPRSSQTAREARHAVADGAERRAGGVGPGDRDLDDRSRRRPASGASSSTSKAKPVVRTRASAVWTTARRKNLNPHWVSPTPGDERAGQQAEHGAARPAAQRLAAHAAGPGRSGTR